MLNHWHILLATVARLRSEGASWAVIAQLVGRSPATCADWPRRFPVTWNLLYRSALRRHDGDIEAMALAALRELMRDDNPDVRLRAAEAVLGNWALRASVEKDFSPQRHREHREEKTTESKVGKAHILESQ